MSLPQKVLQKLTKIAFHFTETVIPLAGLRFHLAERYFQVRRSTAPRAKPEKYTTAESVFATRKRGFSTRPCIFDGSNQKLTSKFSCLFEQKTKVSRHDILSLQ